MRQACWICELVDPAAIQDIELCLIYDSDVDVIQYFDFNARTSRYVMIVHTTGCGYY